MTNEEDQKCGELFEEWVSRLWLSDWAIRFYPDAIPTDMVLEDVSGEAEWTESSKTAVVRILREDCYGDRVVPFDFEKTLVHELLHLKFCLIDGSGNDLQDRYIHQMIDDLARAFVDAKRSGEENEPSETDS